MTVYNMVFVFKRIISQETESFCFAARGAIRKKSEATIQTKPYKLHKLTSGPSETSTVTAEEALTIYKKMYTVRRMETGCATLYKEKAIRGFCHLYNGQEAVAVGMQSVLRKQDTVITSYRCHGWTYLMGISPLGVVAELTGRKSGCSRGKGGSMHMYSEKFYGGNGIVGAQVPLGAGLALAHKYKGDGGVSFSLYGDGAANQGQLFEACNMAKLWDLPAVFICENNHFGMGTTTKRSSASTDYYARGDYIPGIWVDGMDVMSTREATKFAIEYCTSGKGPLMMEISTYRFYGHSMSDPGTSYRTREEVQEMRKTRDPVVTWKNTIIQEELGTEDQLKEMEKEIKSQINAVLEQAKADPEVGPEELVFDIYTSSSEPVRGVHPKITYEHKSLGVAVNKT